MKYRDACTYGHGDPQVESREKEEALAVSIPPGLGRLLHRSGRIVAVFKEEWTEINPTATAVTTAAIT